MCRFYDIKPFTSIDQSSRHVLNWIKNKELKKQYRYAIIYDGKFVGTCGFYSIYWHQHRASIGYDLLREHWNKGIMKKALLELMRKGKYEFDFNRLQGLVLKDNIGSKKVLEYMGFKYEGTLREYEYWEGKGFVDLEMYSVLLKEIRI